MGANAEGGGTAQLLRAAAASTVRTSSGRATPWEIAAPAAAASSADRASAPRRVVTGSRGVHVDSVARLPDVGVRLLAEPGRDRDL